MANLSNTTLIAQITSRVQEATNSNVVAELVEGLVMAENSLDVQRALDSYDLSTAS